MKMEKVRKIGIVVALIAAITVVIFIKNRKTELASPQQSNEPAALPTFADYTPEKLLAKGTPVMVDVGAGTCIPCKLMAPILEELKEELTGRILVQFIDLNKFPQAAPAYQIRVMPTQIFYDASGKERFRHEGFFSKEDILAKWKEIGVDLPAENAQIPTYERLTAAQVDERPRENICYMCDGDTNSKTTVTVDTEKGPVRLCSPHCYFIMYSCLTEDKTDFEKNVTVTNWVTGQPVQAVEAVFLYGQDETTGRSWIKSFRSKDDAIKEQNAGGGNILALGTLQDKELSHRCGFCDRACYTQDAAKVIVDGGLRTWGCCSHCALGVAVRSGRDIEVHEKDRLTGERIIVKTLGGKIASLEPGTAVAWFGQRKKPDGTWGSAGCFHQGFFVSAENLRKWVEQNPYETGRLIPIAQALADKMKLSPEQIKKACKIGECVPK